MGNLGVEWCEDDFWVIDTAYYVSQKRHDLDLRYLYYLISFVGLNHLKDGTSNPSLTREAFYAQFFPVPPLKEQNCISQFLATLDSKIELNRRMSITLEELARAIFNSWFVDFDSETGHEESPSKVPFAQIASIVRDTIDPANFPDELFEHYSIPSFDDGHLPKIEAGAAIKSNKFIVPADAVLLSKLNPRIPRIWLPDVRGYHRSICSTEFLVLRPSEVTREYLYGLCTSEMFLNEFEMMVTGTSNSHQRVKPEFLERKVVVTPDAPLMERFTEVVAPMHRGVALNLRENETLAQLRDVLLPKLLSGEIRIKQAAKTVEAAL